MDFVSMETRTRNGRLQIYPSFKVKRVKDLMIRGRAFYAIWDEERGLWSRDEADLSRLVDKAMAEYWEEQKKVGNMCDVLWMKDFQTGSWQSYQTYLHTMFDTYVPLDSKVTFLSQPITRKDYVSRRLPYDLEDGDPEAYNELMSTLYSKEERRKLEWAVGSILNGDGKDIQKFVVLYGEPGAGKSTFLHIVEQLLEGYWTTFDAKSLASKSNNFATHFFKDNPLAAIQHDGDLSKIEDGALLNSIIAHEDIVVNEKFKAQYTDRSLCFLFLGTNSPVKITDAKSGLIRRLIDVQPTGEKIPFARYAILVDRIPFELGKIANKCIKVYRHFGKKYYNNYRPLSMMFATDTFFNFVYDSIDFFLYECEDQVTLAHAYDVYKNYCTNTNAAFTLQRHRFRDELKEYFEEYYSELEDEHGKKLRSVFKRFRKELFEEFKIDEEGDKREAADSVPIGLVLDRSDSRLDVELSNCSAQYANADGTPFDKWATVQRTLSDLDTTKLHYVKPPENHIVIDFDLKDEKGEKSAELNLVAADKWPRTYAEYSQSGKGVHLHYIYDGDASRLSRIYSEGVEIKVFSGGSSLRRKLTKCNNLPIAHISSGLPLKEDKTLVDAQAVQTEKGLRRIIERNLKKEIHPYTKPSVDFIFKKLEDAYTSGITYDVRDMRQKVLNFAMGSTNQKDACLKLVAQMHFCSDDLASTPEAEYQDDRLIFFDCEVFPNLLLVNWKYDGTDSCVRMINPSSQEVEELFQYKLVGFNNRRYDNHILYARYLGYTNQQIYELSQKIVGKKTGNGFFKQAYNLSYTDVYDFAAKKQSLKKWEIELGIRHLELGLPWDEPVPEDRWIEVAEYCDNDVISTEKLFHHLEGDFKAREILAAITGGSVNDTTNQLTTKLIFGDNRHPELEYTDLSKTFPGYEYRDGQNWYRNTDMGFGGYVYGAPGIYENVALLDIQSMHPNSAIAMNYFGKYTPIFKALVDARVAIKSGDLETAKMLFDQKLEPFLNDPTQADDLAQALKIAINSVYGLTSAQFDNPFRHPLNVNNIVALRGALFMRTLQDEVESRGFKVVSIRTDSIKIANATDDIITFCMAFANNYGYIFEHEATYDRMCLVNDAAYIAKYDANGVRNKKGRHAGEWTATAAQFQQPYVFKKLFSKEEITFDDICETKEVKSPAAMYLDMNEELPIVTQAEKELDALYKRLANVSPDGGEELRVLQLQQEIAQGHNYHFVGRVGRFCPIKSGCGGGQLLVKRDEKFASVSGAKGYRWLEAEHVRLMSREDDIDLSYYNRLVDQAIDDISKYGDFEAFVGEAEYVPFGQEVNSAQMQTA